MAKPTRAHELRLGHTRELLSWREMEHQRELDEDEARRKRVAHAQQHRVGEVLRAQRRDIDAANAGKSPPPSPRAVQRKYNEQLQANEAKYKTRQDQHPTLMEQHEITQGKEERKRGAISRVGEAIYGSTANAMGEDDFLFDDGEMAVLAGAAAGADEGLE